LFLSVVENYFFLTVRNHTRELFTYIVRVLLFVSGTINYCHP
jgi:hypothetical protein